MEDRLLLPHELADPTFYRSEQEEFELRWSKDGTRAALSILVGASKYRIVLTINELDLLRQFLNANVE